MRTATIVIALLGLTAGLWAIGESREATEVAYGAVPRQATGYFESCARQLDGDEWEPVTCEELELLR